MTDEAVVEATLRDKNQFAVLVVRYEAKLDRYVRRLGILSPDDRQDVLQNIFIKTYRNLNDFDQGLSFSSWIYRIAHNEAMSWHRRENVRPTGHLVADSDEVLPQILSDELDPETAAIVAGDALRIETALALVPDKYREPLILRFFEHKEYEEISDILRIPIGTVGTLIYRGKKELKKHLLTASTI